MKQNTGNNALSKLKLGKSVQEIAGDAFSSFNMLRYLWIPSSVKKLDKRAFVRSKLDRGVEMPNAT